MASIAMENDIKKTALIVDEGEDFRDLFSCLLESFHFDVTCVGSGEQAIERVKEKPYFLVLMDVHMPGITGLEALKQMKELRPDQKVIILSSAPDPLYSAERKAFQEGAVDYLLKPIEVADLNRLFQREPKGDQL